MQLELAVDRIEEEKVVLIDQDQRVYVWPKETLPAAYEGQVIFLDVNTSSRGGKKTREDQALAKDILNEILRIE